MYNVCVIRTPIRMCIFVHVNIVYPLQNNLIIVRPTASTRIVREDNFHVPDDHQTT